VRKILVTHALPYANGPLHLGHTIEAVQTDVWVRFQRLRGHDCLLVCAEDSHGTPIMIRAQQQGQSPEQLIAAMASEHLRDYRELLVQHDQFHSTHSEENRRLTLELYEKLRAADYITSRPVKQAYDEQAKMFLPDRYLRGTCPTCKSPDQYGDSCEVCGATYSPADLIDPVSTGFSRPMPKESAGPYHGLKGDIASVGDFIRLYTTRNARWLSPKIVLGEIRWSSSAAVAVMGLKAEPVGYPP